MTAALAVAVAHFVRGHAVEIHAVFIKAGGGAGEMAVVSYGV